MAIELGAIGMSYHDYWHGEFEIADYCIASYKRKQEVEIKNKLTQYDILAYRIGHYVGMTTIIALGGKLKYPEKPIGFNFDKKEELHSAEPQTQIENQMIAYLSKKQTGGTT